MDQHGSLRKPNRNNMIDDEELTLACVAINPNISTREIEAQVINQTTQNDDFINCVLWTDESYFSNCGLFNRNNEQYWAQENPPALIPRRGILGNRLVGPIIFYGNLTAQRYLEILQTSLEDLLDDLPLAQNLQPPRGARWMAPFGNLLFRKTQEKKLPWQFLGCCLTNSKRYRMQGSYSNDPMEQVRLPIIEREFTTKTGLSIHQQHCRKTWYDAKQIRDKPTKKARWSPKELSILAKNEATLMSLNGKCNPMAL
ncbi:hypothetical protein CBL_20819 [Carabus blaptoides fortunei]